MSSQIPKIAEIYFKIIRNSSMAGFVSGGVFGAYFSFKENAKEDLSVRCYTSTAATVIGSTSGLVIGAGIGATFPISVPLLLVGIANDKILK